MTPPAPARRPLSRCRSRSQRRRAILPPGPPRPVPPRPVRPPLHRPPRRPPRAPRRPPCTGWRWTTSRASSSRGVETAA
ncbi:hypothetical protein ACFFX0_19860 [Citricoccus parietis]|uniref:Uncharacterized protein n=1 Tax=Citricoccus parietis TaxID=592307 RepID=A0ABV5G324_9MICC